MNTHPLDVLPIWGLFLVTCGLLGAAIEGGYRLGRWRHANSAGEKEAPVGAMVASILGLLAFMLAFTFNMAATRYDARRQAVLQEANAIGTTYLRARLLPEPYGTEIRRLLREYVDVRIQGVRDGKIPESIVRSEELHDLMWSEGVKAAEHKGANPITTGMFLQSLNEVIDLHAKRVTIGTRNRIPEIIWVVLFGFTLMGIAAVGYQAGLSVTRRSPAMAGVVLAFASVFYLIADLDRSAEGFLTVSQQALIDVQTSMKGGPR